MYAKVTKPWVGYIYALLNCRIFFFLIPKKKLCTYICMANLDRSPKIHTIVPCHLVLMYTYKTSDAISIKYHCQYRKVPAFKTRKKQTHFASNCIYLKDNYVYTE